MTVFRKLFHIAAVVAAMAMTAACSTDTPDDPGDKPETPETPNTPEQPNESQTIWEAPHYKVVSSVDYTKTELVDRVLTPYREFIGETALRALNVALALIPDSYIYREAIIEYTSIDHRGEPITLSGAVTFKTTPTGDAPLNKIIIDSHATITDNASAPSVGGAVGQLLLLKGADIVIMADYQGYGASVQTRHPYLNEALTARQQVDMAKAAIHHINNTTSSYKADNDKTSYSVGYSQGGAVALSVHKLLEREDPAFARAIGFKGSICGDGPYSLVNTLYAYIQQGYVSMPAVLPMMVLGMIESYPELFGDLTIEDFFTPEFLNPMGQPLVSLLTQKQLNILEYNVLYGATDTPLDARFPLENIFRPEAMNPSSPQMQAMLAAFDQNNCIAGWQPERPVCFFHSPDDTVVPYANLNDAAAWPQDKYKIITPNRQGVDHIEGVILFYSDLILKGPESLL